MIPQTTIEAINAYLNQRRYPGGFLYAVLTNDLLEACHRSDQSNQKCLYEIAKYLWQNVPHEAWGSKGRVDAWLEQKPKAVAL